MTGKFSFPECFNKKYPNHDLIPLVSCLVVMCQIFCLGSLVMGHSF